VELETISLDTVLGGILGEVAQGMCKVDICHRMAERLEELQSQAQEGVALAREALDAFLDLLGGVLPGIAMHPYPPTPVLTPANSPHRSAMPVQPKYPGAMSP
jgi:hypothetical protein